MSRVAKSPVSIPSGITVKMADDTISVKGPKGELSFGIHPDVAVSEEDNQLKVSPKTESQSAWA
ncbi:MAG: 50S ribosomal protein L6, partial [Candidatus Thiodiazotropha sp.]